MKKMKKNNLNKPLIISLATILIIATSIGVFAYSKSQTKESTPPEDHSAENINLTPPTSDDKKEAERRKEELANKPTEPPKKEGNSSTPKTVTPVITSWGQSNGKVEVAARVPGVFESGGKCTLTLKKGGQTVTGTANGTENVSEVSCGFIAIPRSSLSPGEWSATVAYSSAKAQGTSQAKNITVK